MTARRGAFVGSALVILGLTQMVADLAKLPAVRGLAAATLASPAPNVFSAVRGLETYSTRFFLEWNDRAGGPHNVEITRTVVERLRGPYNRRNVFGAALAYGPVLAATPQTRPLLDAILRSGLCGNRPLMRELGLDAGDDASRVRVRFEPLPGTTMGDLPRVIEAPCP